MRKSPRLTTVVSFLVDNLKNEDDPKKEDKTKTRLITIRSKPDYVEFVFL